MPEKLLANKHPSSSGAIVDPPGWCPLAVLSLAWAVYLNSVPNGFVLDDSRVVVNNPDIRSLGNLAALFRHDVGGLPKGHPNHTGSYRPLTQWTYALNYALGGLEATGYHLVNVLLHGLCTLCVYQVFLSLLGEWKIAVLAGLLFAAHPIHTEAVSNVAGRSELLSCLFFLLSFQCYQKYRTRPQATPFVLLCLLYLAAILSKESAITLPGVVVALEILLPPSSKQGPGRWKRFFGAGVAIPLLGLAITAALYLGVRSWIVGPLARVPFNEVENPMAFAAPLPAWLTRLYLLAVYARLLIWPVALSADYSYNQIPLVEGLGDMRNLCSLLAVGIYLTLLITSARRAPFFCFALLFAAITFALTSNLLLPIGTVIGERLLYLPSMGFCFAVAWAAGNAARRWNHSQAASAARFALVALVGFYAARTVLRNTNWRSNLSLMESALEASPGSVKVHHNLGHLYAEQGDLDAAESHYLKALKIRPGHPPSIKGLAQLSADLNRTDQAAALYQQALEQDPKDPNLHFNLGVVFQKAKRWPEAIAAFRQALSLQGEHSEARLNLAFCLEQQGETEEAAQTYFEGIRQEPGYVKNYYNLSLLYLGLHRLEDVETCLSRAAGAGLIHPDLLRVRYNLALGHLEAGEVGRAGAHFEYILKHEPDFPHAEQMRADLAKWRR